ncbi:hypothetical protein RIF29_14844 [Crotalaria pallida]|uniref:Endonuclease/exonuclease/phosphatase domain-containing protein n=1 Tax=Crotalaria pallida TaxID=3830 RepID=A0AAN9FG76_CROPI
MILAPWTGRSMSKSFIDRVPIWIQLPNLSPKFWGVGALSKIASLVGNPIMVDKVTQERNRINFARILMEVDPAVLPDEVFFEHDFGNVITQRVNYEWKPVLCANCSMYGHDAKMCRRNVKKQWVEKKKPTKEEIEVIDESLKLKEALEKDLIPEENRERALENCKMLEHGPSEGTSSKPGHTSPNEDSGGKGTVSVRMKKVIVVDCGPQSKPEVRLSLKVRVLTLGIMDNIACWNIRGLNSPSKQKEVLNFHKRYKVGLLGVLENKLRTNAIEAVMQKIAPGWSYFSDTDICPIGRILVLWRKDMFNVLIMARSGQYTHCLVTEKISNNSFFVTFIYAANDHMERKEVWEVLKGVEKFVRLPWIILGDFNTVLSPTEKLGGLPIDVGQYEDLRDCLCACHLLDLKSKGQFHTWCNKQEGDRRIYCKLDRAVVNQAWISAWPNAEANFLLPGLSDHSPILVEWNQNNDQRKPSFKFFNMWTEDDSFQSIVDNVWSRHSMEAQWFK